MSGTTNYLLAGNKIGPAKLQKATKLGVEIISEEQFEAMIAGAEVAEPKAEKVVETKSTEPEPVATQGVLF